MHKENAAYSCRFINQSVSKIIDLIVQNTLQWHIGDWRSKWNPCSWHGLTSRKWYTWVTKLQYTCHNIAIIMAILFWGLSILKISLALSVKFLLFSWIYQSTELLTCCLDGTWEDDSKNFKWPTLYGILPC